MTTLVPSGDVEPDPTGTYAWRVVGARPRMRLDTDWTDGWYRLRMRYRVDDTHPGETMGPQLRLDGLAGPVSSVARSLALSHERVDRIVHLPADADALYIDLPITARAFTLDQVDFRAIGQREAAARMMGPVARTVRQGRAQTQSLLSRAWHSVRTGGGTGLRDQLVADYEAVQRRGAGLVAIPYREWLELHDRRSAADDERIDAAIAAMVDAPVISVVVPTYNTPPELLTRCIESVMSQRYPHWQLCIADDASTDPRTVQVLDGYRSNPRIDVHVRSNNGHISAATNDALAMATGEFVALLDHDDELPDTALFFAAEAIVANPTLDFVYTDEDKIDEHGRRFDPHFKPDFNPELLWGQNYLSHLSVMRRALVAAVGGFREGFEGSQDYDLFLRVIGRTTPDRIAHVPHIGYHWRAVEGSTASATANKTYAVDAGVRALRDHLPAEWTVDPARAPTTYRAVPPRPEPAPKVSIVIPTRNGIELVEQCIASIEQNTTYTNYDILVVDNQSDEPASLAGLQALEAAGRINLLPYDRPFNYSAINNAGVAATDGDLVLLLNNDIEVIEPGWLDVMVRHAVRPDVGAVGAKLLYADDTVQHAGVVLGLGGVAGHGHRQFAGDAFGYFSRLGIAHEAGAVTAACLLTRREIFDQVGGLDAAAFAVAFNDIDFCLRVRAAGYRIIWTPDALLYHHESVSRGAEDTPEKRQRFAAEVQSMLDRWGDELLHDPAYNPNLALDADAFTLAREPRVAPSWHSGANTLHRSTNGDQNSGRRGAP